MQGQRIPSPLARLPLLCAVNSTINLPCRAPRRKRMATLAYLALLVQVCRPG